VLKLFADENSQKEKGDSDDDGYEPEEVDYLLLSAGGAEDETWQKQTG
jgi:hypothetical protein